MILKCLFVFLFFFSNAYSYDLTVVGVANKADGIGRISLGIIETLKEELTINYVSCIGPPILDDVSDETRRIVRNEDRTAGTVSILTNAIWHLEKDNYQLVPDSKIKIAYSMIESTKIPKEWVKILNEQFDAVAVPDRFLISVYHNSGVTIPVFEVSHGMDLDDYLKCPLRNHPSTPFVFGSTVSFDARKNQKLLITAFAKEFKNSTKVTLRLNGRFGNIEFEELKALVKRLKLTNVFISRKVLSHKLYFTIMRSIDCYVNISKGEGFSLCPREALALGIPSILTNNTAQTTLCETGFVRSVPSFIQEPAQYFLFGDQDLGYFFNCKESDVRDALRDMYTKYQKHLRNAHKGREWVKQYTWNNLKMKYLNLVRPKKLILGKKNEITHDYMMTNSVDLCQKYLNYTDVNEFYIDQSFWDEDSIPFSETLNDVVWM